MFELDSDFIFTYRKISCNIYDHERNYTEILGFKRLSAEFKKETPRSSYGGKADWKDNLSSLEVSGFRYISLDAPGDTADLRAMREVAKGLGKEWRGGLVVYLGNTI